MIGSPARRRANMTFPGSAAAAAEGGNLFPSCNLCCAFHPTVVITRGAQKEVVCKVVFTYIAF